VPQGKDASLYFLTAKVHDNDRIEIQFGFEGRKKTKNKRIEYDATFVFISPNNIGLARDDNSKSILKNFQSYLRLHTCAINHKQKSSQRIADQLKKLKNDFSISQLSIFALEIEAYLKSLKRKIELIKEPSRNVYEKHKAEINEAMAIMSHFRENIFQKHKNSDIKLLDEYLSHLFVQFLSQTHKSLPGIEKNTVATYLVKEKEHRKNENYWLAELDNSEKTRSKNEESYLRRVTLLKKYFQSDAFVETKTSQLENRLLIPVYGISAALAATWAILIQVHQFKNMNELVGINTISFIGVAIFAYVIKDIAKDFFRKYFLQSSKKFFADNKKKLYHKEKKIGKIDEHLSVLDENELSSRLLKARYFGKQNSLEKRIGEVFLAFKKKYTLNKKHFKIDQDYSFGLREVMRIRFDKSRPFMEDSIRELSYLNEDASVSHSEIKKTYRTYIATWLNPRENPEENMLFKVFRIKMDKDKITECKEVMWEKAKGTLPPPF